MGPIPMERLFISGPMENYKISLSNVSGSHLLVHCSGSLSQMSSTMKSGSHFNETSLYEWVLWKIVKTLKGPHLSVRDYVSGSQLLMRYSGSVSQMNNTDKSGSHSNGKNSYKWVIREIIKKLIKCVPFVGRDDLSGSQLLMYFSGCFANQ